jgi:NADH-quinone oxidoreductase subunit J
VLCLVLTFFSMACTWLLAGAEFLGVALILVYVGAVMVLFLFVVMMLDIDIVKMREGWVRFLPVGLLVAVVMLVEMLMIGIKARSLKPRRPANAAGRAGLSNTAWLAQHAVHRVPAAVRVRRVILTVAVDRRGHADPAQAHRHQGQNPGEQSRVKASDRLRMVSMPAEKPVRDHDAGQCAAEGEGKA